MNKKLLYSLLTLLLAVSTGAWAQNPEVVYDLTSGWTFDSSAKTMTNGTVTFNAYGSASFKQNNGYVMLGKSGAYLELPAYDFDVEKIEVVGTSSASASVKQNFYVGDVAVSSETTGALNVTNTYEINENYQAAGNVYTLKVTSSHNTQIAAIKVYKKQTSSDTRTAIATIGTLSPTEVTVGDVDEFTLDITPTVNTLVENTDYIVVWETSDDTVLDLDDNTYEALATGEVTVTVTVTPEDDTTYKEVSKTFTVNVMPAPFANIAALAAATTATETQFNVVLNNAVVTYVNGSNVYIQDASGAILYYKSGHGLTAGQILNGTATVKSKLRNNNPQITALTGVTAIEGSAPLPTEVAAEDWDTPISTVLSQYFMVTGAEITYSNSKYYVQLGDENVQLYGQGGASGFSLDNLETTYTILGFPTLYNDVKELVVYVVPENENALEDPQLSYPEESVTVIYGEEYELPELGNPHELEVEFQSSNESVAVVDEAGNVQLMGEEGSTTITAIFWGDEEFESGEASYTLIVKFPARVRAFQKVTATDDITDGNYLIVYQGPKSGQDATEVSVAFNGGLESLDAANNNVPVTIVDDIIVTGEDIYFTIDTSDNSLLSASGIYIGRTSNSNGMQTSSTPYAHVITIDGDGNADILADFNNSTTALRYNYGANDQRFRYYRSGQRAVQLYKEIDVPATVDVTITSAGVASFSSIYPLDFSETDVKAYVITGKEGSKFTSEKLDQVASNTGIIVKGEEGTVAIPVAQTMPAEPEANLLVATSTGAYTTTADDYGYVYGLFQTTAGKIGFQKKKEGWTCLVNRCFVRLPETSSAESFMLDFETTAINAIETVSEDFKGQTYNLGGQKVNANYKGIVIRDGKKQVQK